MRPCRDPRCPGYHHISRCTLTLEGRLPVRPCRYPRRTGSHSASHGGTLNLPYSNQAHPPSRAPPAPRRYSVFQALFADDGNHPSEAGTYLEALVVASTISGAPPQTNPTLPYLEALMVASTISCPPRAGRAAPPCVNSPTYAAPSPTPCHEASVVWCCVPSCPSKGQAQRMPLLSRAALEAFMFTAYRALQGCPQGPCSTCAGGCAQAAA